MWELKDFTKSTGGYLQLQKHGERICDFFPFARGVDQVLVRGNAKYILDILNGGVAAETERCAEIARSMGDPHIADAIEMGAVMCPVVATALTSQHQTKDGS